MKFGGSTANGGATKIKARPYSCEVCKRRYAMVWAKNNHEKLCKENSIAKKRRLIK